MFGAWAEHFIVHDREPPVFLVSLDHQRPLKILFNDHQLRVFKYVNAIQAPVWPAFESMIAL